jgi:hypothetical protein
MFKARPAPPILRDYQDHYRLTSEGWKIASRVVTTPFANPVEQERPQHA